MNYSVIKRKKKMPFAATWMQLEMIALSKSEREKHRLLSLVCEISKNKTN